jgi:hypothetical protein
MALLSINPDSLCRCFAVNSFARVLTVTYCVENLREMSPRDQRRNAPTWAPAAAKPVQLSEEPAIAHLLELPDPIGRLQELLAAKALATAHEAGERMQLDDEQSTTAHCNILHRKAEGNFCQRRVRARIEGLSARLRVCRY